MASSVTIGGIRIDNLSSAEVLERIEHLIQAKTPSRMIVTNASKTVLAQSDLELHSILNDSTIVTADGMSVVWASRLLGTPLKERVTGIDTMYRLLELATNKGYSVYFLGAKEHVVKRVVETFQAKYETLNIVGFHDGYFDKNSTDMPDDIRNARPDIVFVALGSPLQEKWITAHQNYMGVPFCMGVGGSFDHLAGFSKRAPLWMQRIGLEWLHRFAQDPKRLWRRYLIGNFKFSCLVVAQALKHARHP